jgi:hypothetical protein
MLQSCGLAERFDFALTWERHMSYDLMEAGRDIEASTPNFAVHHRTGGRPRSFGSQLISAHGGVKAEGEQGKKMSRYGRPPVG